MNRDRDSSSVELLAAVLDGDKETAAQLLTEMRGTLRAIVIHELDGKTRAKVDASDIVSEGIIKALEKSHTFRGEGLDAFQNWVIAIVRNHARSIRAYWRASMRDVNRERPIAPGSSSGVPIPASEQSSGRQHRIYMVWEALGKLPPAQREAIRLQKLEGWTLARIAERLGRSESAVAGLLKRGKARLSEYLREANPKGRS